MKLFVTYCSAAKAGGEGLLPALERYLSDRIREVYRAARAGGADFRILSGEFGLLRASDPIPDYDHLLTSEEVPARSLGIADQLREIQPEQVVLFSRTLQADPNLAPYRQVMRDGCRLAGVAFEIVEIPGTFGRR